MVAPLGEAPVIADGDVTWTGAVDGSDEPLATAHERTRVAAPLQYRDRDRYEVLAEHGRGGIGRVQRAHDKELGRSVAIKELIKRGDIGEVRFLREAMITARLEHPGIVPIHEAGRWPDGTPFYVMKLVAGRPLKDLIEERHTVEERLGLLHHAIAVADAVAYAHERGIIHRDLKPGNVIAGDFGETVVIDWGLAKDIDATEAVPTDDGPYRTAAASDLTVAGSVVGTPLYMAPEQARGEHVDQRADVYAIGAMLWQLCSLDLVPPADVRQRERVLRRSRIDRDLIAIITKALEPAPADRYRDAGELAADLKAFKAGARIAARRYSVPATIARWIRRHRMLTATVAIALIVTFAGSVAYVRNIAVERDRADAAAAHAEAQRAIAASERDHARLAEASALLDKDPTRARDVLNTLTVHTPEYALLRARTNYGAALRSFYVSGGIARLMRNPDTSQIVAISNTGEFLGVDADRGELRVIDRNVPDLIAPTSKGWLYARQRFDTKTTTIATTTSSESVNVGSLLFDRRGRLLAADGKTYALEDNNLYVLERTGPVLLRNDVRSIAGSDHLLMVCTVKDQLDVMSAGEFKMRTRCASNPSTWPMAASGTDYAALLDPKTLLLVRSGKALKLPTHVTGEYGIVLAASGLLGMVDFDGKPWFVRPGGTQLEQGPPHTAGVMGVAVDGNLVAWGFDDGLVIALDISNGQSWRLVGHSAPVGQLRIDARQSRLFSAAGSELRVWALPTSPLEVIERL